MREVFVESVQELAEWLPIVHRKIIPSLSHGASFLPPCKIVQNILTLNVTVVLDEFTNRHSSKDN